MQHIPKHILMMQVVFKPFC